MQIGLHLPSSQPGASAAGIIDTARLAEQLGFDAVWLFDHLFTPIQLGSKYPYSRDGGYPIDAQDPFFDPLGLLGVLAGATSKLKLGTGVLVAAYRHPIVLGKAVATIENFAPGRLVLGFGAGWMQEEFDAVGVPFEGRGARLEEYLGALRAIWSGKPAAFSGELYRWPEAGFLPAPTGAIPLLVGGHSDAALRRAARVGDGWAIVTGKGQGAGLDAIAARLDLLRAMLAEEGRAGQRFELLAQGPMLFTSEPSTRLPFCGTAASIAASIDRLAGMGVTMIDLIIPGPPQAVGEAARRFAGEVMPLVRAPRG